MWFELRRGEWVEEDIPFERWDGRGFVPSRLFRFGFSKEGLECSVASKQSLCPDSSSVRSIEGQDLNWTVTWEE